MFLSPFKHQNKSDCHWSKYGRTIKTTCPTGEVGPMKIFEACYFFFLKKKEQSKCELIGPVYYTILSEIILFLQALPMGAQWLSGRLLVLRPRGGGFKPRQCHYVVVLEQDAFILA